jgi:hypothetical protein
MHHGMLLAQRADLAFVHSYIKLAALRVILTFSPLTPTTSTTLTTMANDWKDGILLKVCNPT